MTPRTELDRLLLSLPAAAPEPPRSLAPSVMAAIAAEPDLPQPSPILPPGALARPMIWGLGVLGLAVAALLVLAFTPGGDRALPALLAFLAHPALPWLAAAVLGSAICTAASLAWMEA